MHPSSHTAHAPLRPYRGRGLFVTGTGTDVGKTVVTAALAGAFHRLHLRVGVCKPIASGCTRVGHDLHSADAAFAARAAGLNPVDPSLQPYLSPLRYETAVAPSVASRIEHRPV